MHRRCSANALDPRVLLALTCAGFLAQAPRAHADTGPTLRLATELQPHSGRPQDRSLEPAGGDLGRVLRLDRGTFAEGLAPAVPRRRGKAPATLQELLAVVRTNGQSRGEQIAFLDGADDFYLPLRALAEWVRIPPEVPVAVHGDDELVRLRDIEGGRVRFDENTLELAVEFPPEWFPAQVFAYRTGEHADITPSEALGAVVNYGISATRAGSERVQLNFTSESLLSWRGWVLSNELFHFDTSDRTSTLRGLTQLTKDDPRRLTRFVAGDFFAAPTDLTGGLILGGLSYSRAFQIDPYLVRSPTAAYRGLADTPSEVEFYVGGTRIYRQQVSPGPFEIGNVSYLTGQRDVRVVVRDAGGRERTVMFPFYFADRGLAEGFHDFSYQVGAIRENAATESADYGRPAFSATHRYGLNDHLTVGFHAEGTRDGGNVGPALVLRSDALGVASLTALASHDRETGQGGHAYALGYSYQGGPFFGLLSIRRASPDFAFLRTADSKPASPRDDAVSLGYSPPGMGTISLTHRYLKTFDEPTSRMTTLAYTVPFGRDWSVEASYRRTLGFGAGYESLVSVQYRPRADLATFTSLRVDETHTRTASFRVGNLTPEGEGLGYNLAADHSWGPAGVADTVTPQVTYRMREAIVQASVSSTTTRDTRSEVYSLTATGAVAYAGGRVGLSRPVEDSFSVVRIEPPIEGVRVYLNRQEVGRTDASGRVFLPRLVSYVENYLSIEDKDIPIEYAIENPARIVVPYYRSANVAVFQVSKVRAITGTLRYSLGGKVLPLGGVLFNLSVGGKTLELPTATNGDFYFENVPAGEYAASVEVEGRQCAFRLTIPAGDEPVLSIHDVHTCSLP